MAVDLTYIENMLLSLKFKLKDGTEKIYEKEYPNTNGYFIRVNFDDGLIEYETGTNAVIVSNKTTSNFSRPENFVVLECVDRLISKGYTPSSIELEHSWPSGHSTSGRLDILVRKDSKPYIMIECKTYRKEFDKEKNNMLHTKKVGKEEQPKGQLFSYCFQEKTTEYLCLYSSEYDGKNVIYENAIIPVGEDWKKLSNQKELFDHWNKSFKKNGIFDENVVAYNVECKSLLRKDLNKITNEDSSVIFNQFLEILRHNAVSDKPNAFNKILNLFICKIIDEEKADLEELQFQWKDDSTYVSLQSNLEELYKRGMDRFLDVEVTDYSDEDIEKNLILVDSKSKAVIKKMFQELRLQKNPEFAFKEVYNQKSFEDNAKVVREVVELLQPYQFRYGHKQQFLGNFFEQLLNTSIKQESGQFFTPVPIARFMISSLPVVEILNKNVKNNAKYILPVAIDYACGSGHFLTEYMDILQNLINEYDTSSLGRNLKNKIEKWKQTDNEDDNQGEFEWAKDCVYGIEKDYRLVKTSKISTFLNGDGEANIIHADGLDKFSSEKYKGLLSSTSSKNNQFDFVIANPPYSVSAFKQTLPSNSNDFELYNFLTENSSEIECLFVERTLQLLKEGGCAAIILPSSILTNTGLIYDKTREFLIRHFYIRAIAKMGTNTFMATGVNTIIVFIEKRKDSDILKAKQFIDQFLNDKYDFSFNGIEGIVKKYVEYTSDNSYGDYVSLLKGQPTAVIMKSEFYTSIENQFNSSNELKALKKDKEFKKSDITEQNIKINNLFKDYIANIEKYKLLHFALTVGNTTLIVKTGEKQEEKDFLGYEFSGRRRYEGIHYFKDENGNIVSSLYDDEDLFNNQQKTNYYIRKMFAKKIKTIPIELRSNLRYTDTINLLNLENVNYDTTISLIKKPKPVYKCKGEFLGKCCDLKIGGTPSRKNHNYFLGNNLWVSIAEMDGQIINDTKEKLTDEAVATSNVKLVKKGTTLLSFKLSIGKTAIAGCDLYTNEAIAALEIREEYKEKLLDEFLFYLFKSKKIDIEGDTKAFGNSLNSTTLGEVFIPIPSIEEQKEFIAEYKKIDDEIIDKEKDIIIEKDNRNTEIQRLFSMDYPQIMLGDENYLTMKRGPFGGDLKKEIFVSSGYKVYEQKHAINDNFFIGKYYITKEKFDTMKKFSVVPYDIIMSCSGTIGKFALAPQNAEPGVINQALLRFRAKDKILPEYLLFCLQGIVDDFSRHGLGLQNLSSVDSLKTIKIPLPETIDAQQEIVDKVTLISDRIKKLEEEKNELTEKQTAIIEQYV